MRDHLIVGVLLSGAGILPCTLFLMAGRLHVVIGAALVGAVVAYISFRLHYTTRVTALASLLGPSLGIVLAILGIAPFFWLEDRLAQLGVIGIYDQFPHRVPPGGRMLWLLFLATLPGIALLASLALTVALGRLDAILRRRMSATQRLVEEHPGG